MLLVGGAQAAAPDNSLTFNGTSQYVRLGAVGANTDKLNASTFTLEVWFNRTGNGTTTTTSGAGGGGLSAAVPLVAKGRGEAEYSNVDFNYFFGIDDTTDRLAVDFEDSTAVSPNPNNHSFIGATTITNNVWHHAAATYDGSAWRLYLDGRLDATQPLAASPRSDSIQRTAIGSAVTSNGTAGGYFQGSIDEVRIWNVARSYEQIRDTRDDELTSASGLVGRWGLDEGAGTTVADSTSSPISGTLTSNPVGTTPTWNLGQYAFPQDTTPPPAPAGLGAVAASGSVSLTWTASANADLVGYNVYRGTSPGVSTAGTPLNGDSPLSTGAYTDATAANGTTYYYAVAAVDTSNNKASADASATPSATLTALRFDGTDDHVTFGAAPGLATPTFTLETWFKRTGPGIGQQTGSGGLASAIPLITKGRNEAEGTNVDMNYFLGIDTATNRLAVDFEEGATGASPGLNHPLIGNTVIANGTWHHAAATYDGTTWRLYLDGQPDGSLAVGQPARGDSIQHAALGTAMNSTGVAAGFFQGVLDEARVWSVARTQGQIAASMDQELASGSGLIGRWSLNEGTGTIANDSAGSANGALAGGPSWVVGYPLTQPPPVGPHALAFDGTNEHVTFGAATGALGASQFTVETWFRRSGAGVGTSTGTGGITAVPLVTKGRAQANSEGTNADMNYFVGIDATSGVLVGDFEDSATGLNHPVVGTTAVAADNSWHHAAASYDGTTWRLYLDGKLENREVEGAFTPRSDSIQHAALGTAIDSTGAADGFFQGTLDEARVWGVARASAQIRAAKDSEIAGAQAGLLARWGLDEGSGSAVGDTSGHNVSGTAVNGPIWVSPYGFAPDSSAPADPTGLSAAPDDGAIALSWTANGESDLAGYDLFRSTSPGVSTAGAPVNGSDLIRGNGYQDTGLSNGTAYYYVLVAVDGSNNRSGASNEDSATPLPAGSKGLQFNGSSQYATFGAAPGLATPTFTLETWFMRTGTGVGQQTGTGGLTSAVPLISKGRNQDEGSNVDMNYFLGIDTVTNALAVDFEEGPGGSGPLGQNHPLVGATPVTNNVWHHAAATYDGTTWKLYLDGKLDKSLAVGEPARGDSIQHAALGTAMTSTGVAAGFFQGVLDEARVWNHARTGAEIRTSKNLEAPSSTSGLLGHWHLDEASGTAVGDSSGNGNNGTTVAGPTHVSAYGFAPDATPPAAVQGVSATAGDSSATLDWDAGSESDLAGYDVFRGPSSPVSTSGTPLNGEDLLTTPGFTDTGLTNAQTYYYAVVAVDSSNNAAQSAETFVTPAPADPVFVGAGDIAGSWAGDEATADLLDGIPGTVFTIGDNAYDNGLASEFATYYDPTWGRHKARTHPAPGNHDYGNGTNDGSGYFDYFNGVGNQTGPAGDRALGYYSYDLSGNGATWHIVVLNSECESSRADWLADGCAAGSAQEQWLRNDLENAPTNNIIALWHKPRYSSSTLQPHMQALWQALYDYGVEFVLGGHWHNYERLGPMNASGAADGSYGVRQFVVGTGGASFAGFGTPWPTSEVRNNNTTGVIKFTLHQTTYDWQFIPTAGLTFTDSGTGTVHGPPPDTNAPTVTVVSAVPVSLGPSDSSTDVTWHASENGSYSVRVGGTSCVTGTQVATGSYATAPANVVTTIDASELAEGANTIRVCVTDSGTNTGSATTSVSKNSIPAANALHFDGAGDSVSFGQATSSLGATEFALETWFRRTGAGVATSTGSGGVTDAIPLVTKGRAENDTPANVNMNYFLGIDASSGVLVADFEDDAGGENHPISGTTQINADSSWHHAAVSYDGSAWRLYLDGRLENKLPTGGETPEDTSIQHAGLGAAFNSTGVADGSFAGDLDEVRIWDVGRTGAEIRAGRNSEITGSQAGLLGRWGLDEGAGPSAADSSGHNVTGTITGASWILGYGFPQDGVAPATPTGLNATPGDTQVALTWTANGESDVAGYNLYRSNSPGVSTSGTPVNGSDLVTGTAYTDVGLTNGQTYYYVLVAVDGSNNASGASTEKSAAPVQGDPVLVGAGDIADCARSGDTDTANLVSSIPGTVWTAGDNVYQNGLLTEFNNCYEPTWGAFKARTRPTPGNHDYGNGSNDGDGYFDYFNGVGNSSGPAGDRDKGYYSYDVGDDWHVVVLNSECYYYPVCGSATLSVGTAAQIAWLEDDLGDNASKNVVAMFHKPRWSSGASQPGLSILQPLWQTLYENGADLVLVGHDHHYERFAPQNGAGQLDTSFGVRQFIVGTGGASHTAVNTTAPNSQFRNGTADGILKLTLHQSSYDWQFLATTGGILDSGTNAVHAAPNLPPVIDSVTINETTPKTNDLLTATVTSHDPNNDSVTYAYQWRRNGADIVGATGSTLNLATAGNGDRGDQITLRVTGSDSSGPGAPLTSSAVTVQNSTPIATVALNTHTPDTNDVLTATATRSDLDTADTVTLTYVWKTNGVVKKTTAASSSLTDTFDLAQAGNGDAGQTVSVEVTPSDGTSTGTTVVDSAPIDVAPAAPTGLTTSLTTSAVLLDWANNSESDLAGYNVYRAAAAGGPYTKLNAAVLTPSAYNDATAPAQATSYYQVRAVDTGGAESDPASTSVARGIAFRAASTGQTSNGNSLALTRPAGVVAGDVLLAVLDARATPTITAPAGWTAVRSDTSGTALRQAVYVHAAGASEPASYSFSFSGKVSASGAVLAYIGVSTSQPVDGSSGRVNTSGTSILTNAVNTTVADDAVIGLFGAAINTSVSPPAGMIERAETSTGGKDKATTEAADQLQASAGTTGSPTATAAAAAVSIGQVVALRPSTAAPPPQDTEAPSKPGALSATAVSSSQIDLTWTASVDNVGVTRYEVYRGTTLAGTTAQTQFSDTGLTANTPYTYTVKAFDAAGNSAESDPASATTPPGGGGSAITFRGATTADTRSGSSLAVPVSSSSQDGDVLIASLDVRGNATITAPAGWTLVRADASGSTLTKATYLHVAGASEPASYTWTFSADQAVSAVMLAYDGVDTSSPIDVSNGGSGTGASIAAPAVTISSAGSMLVSLVGLSTNGGLTQQAGMTERAEVAAGSGQARVSGEASDTIRGAGTSGTITTTAGKSAPWVGQLVVLRPAP